MLRLFVAVYPLEKVDRIVELQEKLAPYVVAKFVEKQNLHITLSFIGNVPEEDKKMIEEKLNWLLKKWKSFSIRLDGLQFIPNENFIHVIGIKILNEKLLDLARSIGKVVNGSTKPPHLTLCRVKKVLDKPKLIELKKTIQFDEEVKINRISLVRSVLKRSGPVYQIVKQFNI